MAVREHLVTAEMRRTIQEFYDALNVRDVDRVLRLTDEQIVWPESWEGSRVVGRRALRSHLKRRFRMISTYTTLGGFWPEADGRVRVSVDQSFEDAHGDIVIENGVDHLFTFHEGLIIRLEFAPAK